MKIRIFDLYHQRDIIIPCRMAGMPIEATGNGMAIFNGVDSRYPPYFIPGGIHMVFERRGTISGSKSDVSPAFGTSCGWASLRQASKSKGQDAGEGGNAGFSNQQTACRKT
jgi:hypothetical protein